MTNGIWQERGERLASDSPPFTLFDETKNGSPNPSGRPLARLLFSEADFGHWLRFPTVTSQFAFLQ